MLCVMMQVLMVTHNVLNKLFGFSFKIYDAKEQEWKLLNDGYQSILPDRLSWENWAKDNKDGKAMTGEALLNFVNNDLFPY